MLIKLIFSVLLLVMPILLGGNRWWIINPFEFCISLIFIFKLKEIIKSIKEHSDLKNCILIFSVFGLLILFTSIFSINPHSSMNTIAYFIALYFCFLITSSSVFSKNDRRFFMLVMIFSGSIQPIITLFQLNGYIPKNHWLPDCFVAGTFCNHNHFASFMSLTLIITLSWLFSLNEKQKGLKVIFILSSIIQFLGIILSQSRGAWIGLICSVFYLSSFALNRKNFIIMLFVSFILIVVFSLFLPQGQEAIRRLKTFLEMTNDISIQTRIEIWKSTIKIIKENLFSGTGIGTYRDAMVFFKPKGITQFVNHAHNDYLQWIAECGVFSIIFIISILLILIRRGLLFTFQNSFLPIACGASTILIAVHSFFDYNTRIPAIGFYMAILIGFSYSGKKLQHII